MIGAIGAQAPVPEAAGANSSRDPEKVKDAARQFEGLMIAQLLRSMRSGEKGWLGTGEDETSDSMMELAEEQLARTMAEQGGIGLASMVIKGLEGPAGETRPAGIPGAQHRRG